MRSLDTETTGIDLHHGAKPFFVTVCDENGEQLFWEWDIDPLSREPQIPDGDINEILEIVFDKSDELVLQNPKFDAAALTAIDERFSFWPWDRTKDTLRAGHVLASNHPHDLTTMAVEYLGLDIEKYEKAVKVACTEARRIVRRKYPTWKLAEKDGEGMPSAKDATWKFDMWLPRAVAKAEGYPANHSWWNVTKEYANTDSAVTLPIFLKQKQLLENRGLWKIYLECLKVQSIAFGMEQRGITLNKKRLIEKSRDCREESEAAGRICTNLAKGYGYDLELPRGSVNKSLKTFMFDVLKLPTAAWTPKGEPALNKAAMSTYLSTLPANSKPLSFIRALANKRKRDTAVSYMTSYKRFWLDAGIDGDEWYRLHPSLNPTGTNTLRWSSQNPNEQNISKQEGFNLRYLFGPLPGREWWSLDAKNIELRLPAYEAQETEMMALFERPNDPPYYGSYHLLVFDTLHPEKFAKDGAKCKDIYESTWYSWTKNGNFAVQYGAVEASGTADRAYHVEGAQHRIQSRFGNIAKLNQRMIDFAGIHGYVETLPDKTVDPERGYPLLCTRSKWGGIEPTVPLNYHIQGSAMWWMQKSMIRCQAQIDKWNEGEYRLSHRCAIVLQVHDELVFDFPARPRNGNLPYIRKLKSLMEQGGDDFGIPTPVSMKRHEHNWGEGITVAA